MEYRCSVGEDWRNSVSAANPLIFINALGDRGDCVKIPRRKTRLEKGVTGAIFVDEARVDRRLAAILAADVAGYSRLMGVDEEGTLRQLKAHRKELVDPKITEHRGRIVKTTGDGMLVEFVSVVDAVRCAVDIQRDMADATPTFRPRAH